MAYNCPFTSTDGISSEELEGLKAQVQDLMSATTQKPKNQKQKKATEKHITDRTNNLVEMVNELTLRFRPSERPALVMPELDDKTQALVRKICDHVCPVIESDGMTDNGNFHAELENMVTNVADHLIQKADVISELWMPDEGIVKQEEEAENRRHALRENFAGALEITEEDEAAVRALEEHNEQGSLIKYEDLEWDHGIDGNVFDEIEETDGIDMDDDDDDDDDSSQTSEELEKFEEEDDDGDEYLDVSEKSGQTKDSQSEKSGGDEEDEFLNFPEERGEAMDIDQGEEAIQGGQILGEGFPGGFGFGGSSDFWQGTGEGSLGGSAWGEPHEDLEPGVTRDAHGNYVPRRERPKVLLNEDEGFEF